MYTVFADGCTNRAVPSMVVLVVVSLTLLSVDHDGWRGGGGVVILATRVYVMNASRYDGGAPKYCVLRLLT